MGYTLIPTKSKLALEIQGIEGKLTPAQVSGLSSVIVTRLPVNEEVVMWGSSVCDPLAGSSCTTAPAGQRRMKGLTRCFKSMAPLGSDYAQKVEYRGVNPTSCESSFSISVNAMMVRIRRNESTVSN